MAMTVAMSPSSCEALTPHSKEPEDGNSKMAGDTILKGIKLEVKQELPIQFAQTVHSGMSFKGRKFHRKRHHSTTEETPSSSHAHLQGRTSSLTGKHRRQNSGQARKAFAGDIILPTKFLLGGNISDPLNLNSMLDENVNKALNAVTPSSSPLPPRNSKISIVIPSDMTDPLGLTLSQEEDENEGEEVKVDQRTQINESLDSKDGTLKSNLKKKKRRRKSQHEKIASLDRGVSEAASTNKSEVTNATNVDENVKSNHKHTKTKKPRPGALDIEQDSKQKSLQTSPTNLSIAVPQLSSVIVDPIVSPVIPQDVRRSSAIFSPKSKKRKSSSVTSVKQLFPHSVNVPNPVTAMDKSASDLVICADKNDENNDFSVELTNEIKAARLKTSNNGNLEISPVPSKRTKTLHRNNEKPKTVVKFKSSDARFQYGNYSQYYGYRNPQKFQDVRMSCMKKDWFKDKDILDVGCNVGHLTLLIARDFAPRKVVGVDIDDGLIKAARHNIRHYATTDIRPPSSNCTKFPDSMAIIYGPIIGPPVETGKDDLTKFPNNVVFLTGNYVPEKDEVLQCQEPEYDVIMCMSVTKWLHMNWGDDGLKKTFQRMYKQLRPGGKLILEPQNWKSYGKKKKLTERIYKNYNTIVLKPEMFPKFLIDEIGFEKVEYLQLPVTNKTKGFQRPIQLYYKPE